MVNFYDVERGNLKTPEFVGDYKIPVVGIEDYRGLMIQSAKNKQDVINKSKDLFKNIKAPSTGQIGKNGLSSPIANEKLKKIHESYGINDDAMSRALSGDRYALQQLESNYAKLSNAKEVWELYKEEHSFNEFKKNASKIKDSNMQNQAYASIIAYENGEDDPIIGKKMRGTEFNLGHFNAVDLEDQIDKGLEPLITKTEELVDRGDGSFITVAKKGIDPQAGQTFFDVFTKDPAVQRTMVSRNMGNVTKDETGNDVFSLNEAGKAWVGNILKSKTTSSDDIQAMKFATKAYMDQSTRAGGFITDDIAKASVIEKNVLETKQGKVVERKSMQFDENVFSNNFDVKLNTPEFRNKAIEQGLVDQNGNKLPGYQKMVDNYRKTMTTERIGKMVNTNNGGRGGSKKGGASSSGGIRGAIEDEGLIYIKAPGGIDQTKKVNYRTYRDAEGNLRLKVGSGTESHVLKEGVHYKKKPDIEQERKQKDWEERAMNPDRDKPKPKETKTAKGKSEPIVKKTKSGKPYTIIQE